MPTHIIYLSHGGKKYYDQARFSVLTLLHLLVKAQRTDVRIVVYTDDPSSVPAHALIDCMPLTKAQLRAYRGPLDYVHRIKLKVLEHAARHFGTALLYVDCDTRWLALPDDILALLQRGEGAVMHIEEGQIGAAFFPHYAAALARYRTQLHALGVAQVPTDLMMWNAGAIGAPAGAESFFAKVVAVNDFLLERVKPRNWAEQLAVSLVAMDAFKLHALGAPLHHYWNYSYEAPLYLAELFAKMGTGLSTEREAEYCAGVAWDEARLKALQAAPEHKRKRRRNKWRGSIAKRKVDLRVLIARLTRFVRRSKASAG
jgi:hypothetical protein